MSSPITHLGLKISETILKDLSMVMLGVGVQNATFVNGGSKKITAMLKSESGGFKDKNRYPGIASSPTVSPAHS